MPLASKVYQVLTEGEVTYIDPRTKATVTLDQEWAQTQIDQGWVKFGGKMGGQERIDAYLKSLKTEGTITNAKASGSDEFFTQVKRSPKSKTSQAAPKVVDSASGEEVTYTAVKHLLDSGKISKAAARKLLGL